MCVNNAPARRHTCYKAPATNTRLQQIACNKHTPATTHCKKYTLATRDLQQTHTCNNTAHGSSEAFTQAQANAISGFDQS